MKKILILILTIVGVDIQCQVKYIVPDIPLMNEWGKVSYFHVDYDSTLREGDAIEAGDKIGRISPLPESYSVNFDADIKQSMHFYSQKDFKNAVAVLNSAIVLEPGNFFVLDNYARACYWIDRETSYRVYQKLVNTLDSIYYVPGYVSVDYWFAEAYWKLGTLYMDNELYDKAYFEISRALLCMQHLKGQYVYVQALEYLTECAFMMKDANLAKHLAKRTLHYDPGNAFVNDMLKHIDKGN